jgi:phosphate transport system substrate-binding protein
MFTWHRAGGYLEVIHSTAVGHRAAGRPATGPQAVPPDGGGRHIPRYTSRRTGGRAELNRTARAGLAGLAAVVVALAPGGCATPRDRIEGAGATFPTLLYQDWIHSFTRTVDPGFTVDYQSIGSGGGITQFLQQTVDWGTSERYLRDSDLADAEVARGCPAIQVPVVFGAVVIALADPALDGLVLDAHVISAIFRREITRYDDPRIAALNPDLALPARDIIAVHRSDGSGTTSVFTTWLADEDPAWERELGAGVEVNWPAGTVGGPGNEGVAANLRQSPGGLGYVNQSYAMVLELPQARVVNADGDPVYPTPQATAAGLERLRVPDDFQFDILGIGGDGYPILGTVWNFFWECGYAAGTAEALRTFWRWALTEGDSAAIELGYTPLTPGLKDRVLAAIDRIGT